MNYAYFKRYVVKIYEPSVIVTLVTFEVPFTNYKSLQIMFLFFDIQTCHNFKQNIDFKNIFS